MVDAFVSTARERSGVLGKAAEDPAAQQACAEAAETIDEIKTVLHRNMKLLWDYAERGEVPPVAHCGASTSWDVAFLLHCRWFCAVSLPPPRLRTGHRMD
jgi:hypothetical protein